MFVGSSDLNVWQYDSALTLAYLSRKVQRLSIALQKANINVSGSAQSEKFVQSNRQTVDEGLNIPRCPATAHLRTAIIFCFQLCTFVMPFKLYRCT